MSKANMKSKHGSRVRDNIEEEFSVLAAVTLAAGANNVAMNPSLASRLSALADAYEFYRLRKLKFRVHPNGTQSNMVAAVFQAGVVDTAPTTVLQCSEGVNSTFNGSRATVPSAWCEVAPEDLKGAFPWYKSVQGTPDTSEEIVGYIYLAGSTTESISLEVRGVMEFKQSIAPANTPMEVELRARLRQERQAAAATREREVLLKALSPPSVRQGFFPPSASLKPTGA
jgi:predicted enzyme related to lactoylglutathione lyase